MPSMLAACSAVKTPIFFVMLLERMRLTDDMGHQRYLHVRVREVKNVAVVEKDLSSRNEADRVDAIDHPREVHSLSTGTRGDLTRYT